MLSNKIKAVVILGGFGVAMLLTGLLGIEVADAQTITVSPFCTETPETSQGIKITNYSYDVKIFRWERVADHMVVESGQGELPGNVEKTFVTGRTSAKDTWRIYWTNPQFINWGIADLAHLEVAGCVKDFVATPEPTPIVATPAEDPQVLSMMQTIIDLLKQIIALRLAR